MRHVISWVLPFGAGLLTVQLLGWLVLSQYQEAEFERHSKEANVLIDAAVDQVCLGMGNQQLSGKTDAAQFQAQANAILRRPDSRHSGVIALSYVQVDSTPGKESFRFELNKDETLTRHWSSYSRNVLAQMLEKRGTIFNDRYTLRPGVESCATAHLRLRRWYAGYFGEQGPERLERAYAQGFQDRQS
jgi:hypothetical protein